MMSTAGMAQTPPKTTAAIVATGLLGGGDSRGTFRGRTTEGTFSPGNRSSSTSPMSSKIVGGDKEAGAGGGLITGVAGAGW